jgi:hypothetical protein
MIVFLKSFPLFKISQEFTKLPTSLKDCFKIIASSMSPKIPESEKAELFY